MFFDALRPRKKTFVSFLGDIFGETFNCTYGTQTKQKFYIRIHVFFCTKNELFSSTSDHRMHLGQAASKT
jgi:hypothetical protein